MIEASKLQSLLRQFNEKGYADPSAGYEDNRKGGKVLKLQIEQFTYEDEFYGGEPYSGNETIWENEKPVFRCVYWGKVIPGVKFGEIYDFLRKAISQTPDGKLVHRGPQEYVGGNLRYTNSIDGDIEEFRQVEKIFLDDREVYVAYFVGGRVDVQNE